MSWKYFKKPLSVYNSVFMNCIGTFLESLPNDGPFSKARLWFWRKQGYDFGENCVIFRNVYFLGLVKMGRNSTISNNSFLNGGAKGIFIGNNVMISVNCVLVAFDHGISDLEIPMIEQPWEYAEIVIDDDVWIGANCTITKGVHIGKGSIVGANSVVTKDVASYSIVAGVPAKVIGSRLNSN